MERLETAGMRSLSLVVDVMGCVMFDLGQPMYAYGLLALVAPTVVRRAKAEERLRILDKVKRELDPGDLLITDSPESESSCIIGLAGVMGDAYFEVEESTTDILLEATYFDPVLTVRISCCYHLSSEAFKRFKRGADP